MSNPTTPSPTGSGSANPNGNTVPTLGPNNSEFRVVRKRNRVPLSCAPCRTRKLKCNRSHPCENCVKRGDAPSCSYASPNARRKQSTRSSGPSTPDDMQNRINRLETILLTFMSNGSEAPPGSAPIDRTFSVSTGAGSGSASASADINTPSQDTPSQPEEYLDEDEVDSETDKVAKSFGVLHVNNNNKAATAYLGEAHWGSVLNDIAEVKNWFTEHKKQYDAQIQKVEATKKQSELRHTGPAFVLGGRSPPTMSELLGSLQGRDTVDNLVQRYFSAYDATTHILHVPSWRREYEKHWNDPRNTSPVFLGQLYAMCGLAMQSYHRDSDEPIEIRGRALDLANNYRMLTQQCMLLFDTVKVEHAIVETYVLHLQSEYSKAGDTDVSVWILMGMVVRLAMRMGLHRDPSHFPSLTTFQGEMRRRLWTYIRLADIFFSVQIGLPNTIRSSDCDTNMPLNLYDEDFDETSESLPPAQLPTVYTPMSYMIAKASIAFVLGRIVECIHAVRPPAYEDIMRFDREMLDTYHALPSALQMKPLEESGSDPIPKVLNRIHLSVLFNKSLCILHRKFLTRARENPRYSHSRRSCVDASVRILRFHHSLHQESQTGRLMEKAYLCAHAQLKHDFILAGTLLCLDLLSSAQQESTGRPTGDADIWGVDRRDEIAQALEQSRAIWGEQRDRYIEAFKAYEMVGIMLQKIQSIRAQTAARMARGAFAYAANGGGMPGPSESPQQRHGPTGEDAKPEHSAALTLGMLSTGGPASKPGYNAPYATPPSSNSNNATLPDLPNASMSPQYGINSASVNGNFGGGPGLFPFFNGSDMEIPANIDWTALDSYISNPNTDPSNEMWTQNMDVSAPPIDTNATSAPNLDPSLPQYHGNIFNNNPGMLFPANGPM